MKPLPADFIPCYRESVLACGKVTLSEEYALRLFAMAASSVIYRRALEQIGQNGTSNADLALQARNALREEVPSPPPRKRLVGIDTVKPRLRVREPVL
jgi:hypothetical protein